MIEFTVDCGDILKFGQCIRQSTNRCGAFPVLVAYVDAVSLEVHRYCFRCGGGARYSNEYLFKVPLDVARTVVNMDSDDAIRSYFTVIHVMNS